MKNHIIYAVFILYFIIIEGCSHVQPWERNHLANKTMQWGSDPQKATLENHIYSSKEASSGGNAAASGGCGCN